MKEFAGRIAVITGGGTGMGRELARQLVAEGCNVAMCDVSEAAMAETKRLCEVEKLPQGLRVTTHVADVSIEDQLKRFRDELIEQQKTAYAMALCDWSSDVCSSDLSQSRLVSAIAASETSHIATLQPSATRSEERRVGKEC